MNKKGIYFDSMLAVVSIILFIYLAYVLSVKTSNTEPLGENQIGLLNAHYSAEKILYYIDLSAIYSSNYAIHKLASESGFYNNDCGIIEGYFYWNKIKNPSELCEKDVFDNFAKHLNDRLYEYLGIGDFNIPENNYDYFIDDNVIRGFAVRNYEINFDNGKYSFKPSFFVELNHSLNVYEDLKSLSKLLINSCSFKRERNDCVKSILSDKKDITYRFSFETVLMDVSTNIKSYYEKDFVKLKIALRIPKEELT